MCFTVHMTLFDIRLLIFCVETRVAQCLGGMWLSLLIYVVVDFEAVTAGETQAGFAAVQGVGDEFLPADCAGKCNRVFVRFDHDFAVSAREICSQPEPALVFRAS